MTRTSLFLFLSSYQKEGGDVDASENSVAIITTNDAQVDIEKEQAPLVDVVGYGAVVRHRNDTEAVASFDAATDFPLPDNDSVIADNSNKTKRWAWLALGVVVYVAVAHVASNNHQGWNLTQDVNLLGSSKVSVKEAKKSEKAEAKKEKEEAKEAAKAKKQKEKEAAKVKKEAAKEAAKEEKAAEKKEKKKEKAAEKAKKEAAKTAWISTYPGCPGGVNITYVKYAMPFEDHEIYANASGCHLA